MAHRQDFLRGLVIELAGIDLLLGKAGQRCRRRRAQRTRALLRYDTLLAAKSKAEPATRAEAAAAS